MTEPEIWHIITGEYPPKTGGVSDYTYLLAHALAKHGIIIHIWTKGNESNSVQEGRNIVVHRMAGSFGPRGLWRINHKLNTYPRSRRILIQYVPHAYGWKALNLYFAMWVYFRRRIYDDDIRTMFHEVCFPWVRRPLRHNILAIVNRIMAGLIARVSRAIYISIPAWEPLLRGLTGRAKTPMIWVPVPANVAEEANPEAIRAFRGRLPHGPVIAHFGTFGNPIGAILTPAIDLILQWRPEAILLLLGRNSERYRLELLRRHPTCDGHIVATGGLPSNSVAIALRASDVALQPYDDGVCARRGSLMAVIANGVPAVTNLGKFSEPIWNTSGLGVCPTDDPTDLARMTIDMLDDAAKRESVGVAGRKLYTEHFTLQRTVEAMLADPETLAKTLQEQQS